MKENFRINILGLIAVTSLGLFILPEVMLLRLLLFGHDGGSASVLMFFAMFSAGYFAGILLFRKDADCFKAVAKWPLFRFPFYLFGIKEKERFISNFAGFISGILPLAAAYAFFGAAAPLRTAFEMLFAFVPYLLSLRNSGRSYFEILVRPAAIFGFVVLAVVNIIANYWQKANYLEGFFYALLYIYILFFLVLRNQEDIDANIYSRKYIQKSILPRNMRGFNLIAVTGLYLVMLLLFNLNSVVTAILDKGRIILRYLFLFLIWFIGLIYPGGDGMILQEEGPTNFGFYGGNEIVRPFGNLVWNTFKVFILLYLLYKLGPFLLKGVVSLVKKLAALARKVFSRYVPASDANEYDDVVEIIKPGRERKHKRDLRRSIEAAMRQLGKITDPVERIRLMYAILTRMLREHDVAIEKSDTISEIFCKAKHIDRLTKPFLPVTGMYGKVRYGGHVPDKTGLSDYENCYTEASEAIRAKGRL